MAERVEIKEREFVSSGSFGSEEKVSNTVTSLQQLGDSKITYAKPQDLNKRTNEVVENFDQGKWNTIETTSYTLTKPHGQNNTETAKYGSKGAIEKGVSALSIVVDIITQYFQNKKQ